MQTQGGFIHIYGEIGHTHEKIGKTELKGVKGWKPYSHSELNNYSVIQVVGGNNFIAVVVETGEIYALDGCMDLVSLPKYFESKIEYITANSNSL